MLRHLLVVVVAVVIREKLGTKANRMDRMLLDYRSVEEWVGVGGSKAGVRKGAEESTGATRVRVGRRVSPLSTPCAGQGRKGGGRGRDNTMASLPPSLDIPPP